MVAAFAEPIPKLIMVNPDELVDACNVTFSGNVAIKLAGELTNIVIEIGEQNVVTKFVEFHSGVARQPVLGDFESIVASDHLGPPNSKASTCLRIVASFLWDEYLEPNAYLEPKARNHPDLLALKMERSYVHLLMKIGCLD